MIGVLLFGVGVGTGVIDFNPKWGGLE
jgi:hypothetical protein